MVCVRNKLSPTNLAQLAPPGLTLRKQDALLCKSQGRHRREIVKTSLSLETLRRLEKQVVSAVLPGGLL